MSDDVKSTYDLHRLYHYRVWFSDEDGEHGCTCDELPSLSTLSEIGPAHALEAHLDLVHTVLMDMQARGEELPQPLSFGAPWRGGEAAWIQVTNEHSANVDGVWEVSICASMSFGYRYLKHSFVGLEDAMEHARAFAAALGFELVRDIKDNAKYFGRKR